MTHDPLCYWNFFVMSKVESSSEKQQSLDQELMLTDPLLWRGTHYLPEDSTVRSFFFL